jgi:hypothetical protein
MKKRAQDYLTELMDDPDHKVWDDGEFEFTQTQLTEFAEEYAQQVKPDTIKTVNPHGYLLEGRYVSFEEMKNRTNFEGLDLIPLYLK